MVKASTGAGWYTANVSIEIYFFKRNYDFWWRLREWVSIENDWILGMECRTCLQSE